MSKVTLFAEPFVRSTKNAVTLDSMDTSKPLVVVGVTSKKYVNQCRAIQRDFYYMDSGYFGNFRNESNPKGKKHFIRIVKNDVQKNILEEYPSDRWKEICKIDPKYQWNGWKKKGNKLLIVVPNRKACVFYGYEEGKKQYRDPNKPTWLMNTIETIKKHTDMEIVVREKGSRPERHNHSIFDALDEGIFATVAFNSIAAIESIVYGVPAFVTVPCAASPLALMDLTQINTPYYPCDQLIKKHCSSLAYGQFTSEEIENGYAWDILQGQKK
jgi:hypothetical protein